jgi:hypothetical protein
MAEYKVTRVYNADQTAVYFEMLPKHTVSARGVQTVWVSCGKREKQRATAMLLADSDGNKYPLLLVFKTQSSKVPDVHEQNVRLRHGFGVELWKSIQAIQSSSGTQVYENPSAWWNADLTIAWLEFHFGDRTPKSEPVLLLLDAFPGHWTAEVLACAAKYNVFLKSVPQLTWRSQLADVSWMKPLKDSLRRRWVEHFRAQVNGRPHSGASGFVVKPPGRADVAAWVKCVCDEVVCVFPRRATHLVVARESR